MLYQNAHSSGLITGFVHPVLQLYMHRIKLWFFLCYVMHIYLAENKFRWPKEYALKEIWICSFLL